MKKIFHKLTALVLASVCLLPVVTACGHEHSASLYETVTEPTCRAEGLKKGICGICQKEFTKVIPADPDNHVFPEWTVAKPTKQLEGLAQRKCEACGEEQKVTLPVINLLNYDSSITKRPTVKEAGERTYSYAEFPEYGIKFTEVIDAKGDTVLSMEDAVAVGSMEDSKNYIREGSATNYSTTYRQDGTTPKMGGKITYEYGNNYTHIQDEWAAREYWYEKLQNGEIVGFTSDTQNSRFYDAMELGSAEGNAMLLNGASLKLTYQPWLGEYYGAEHLLDGLYRNALINVNGDFQETTPENKNGEYSFSFGTTYGSASSDYFSNVEVKFKLAEDFTVKELNVKSVAYINDRTGSEDKYNIITWEFGEDKKAVITNKRGPRIEEEIKIKQTRVADSNKPAPTNPYSKDTVYYDSFDVYYKNQKLEGNTGLSFDSGKSTGSVFVIKNLLPAKAAELNADKFAMYIRTKENGKNVDELINFESKKIAYAISDSSKAEKKFLLNSKNVAGDVTLVVKSAHVEREFTINFKSGAPSSFSPLLYQYSPQGYREIRSSGNSITAEIYQGQPLYFSAEVPEAEANRVTKGYNVAISSSDDCFVQTVEIASEGDVKIWSAFRADRPGNYTLTLSSVANPNVKCTVQVTVKSAPSAQTLLRGEYTTEKIIYFNSDSGINISDKPATVKFSNNGGKYIAEITFNGSVQKIECDFTTEKYENDVIPVGGNKPQTVNVYVLKCTTLEDAADLNFSLTLNEAYDLVLTFPTIGEEGARGSVILSKGN